MGRFSKYYDERKCVVCKNIFFSSRGQSKKGRPGVVRPKNCKTCSPKCSSIKRWNDRREYDKLKSKKKEDLKNAG